MRPVLSLSKGVLPFAVAAALVLTAGACATPSAEKSSAEGRAGAPAKAGGQESEGKKKPWWRLSQYSRKPTAQVSFPGDVRPGKGLLGGDEDGFVLYRKGEAGGSSDSGKPTKVRR